ncbi:heme exporter protein CcmD [Roseibium algae]|uniref:Heme exporter protein D n=1 Tax=Roseibium algae TaxID=3123038 RepID=A0ABU8TQF8_9HYPH
MDLGPHSDFIISSYAICFAVVLGLILWVRMDRAKLEATLKELAARGVSRNRSAEQKPEASGQALND